MEHHYTASKLAKFGRNGDSMLVHMTPHEVAGLQYLAMSHGGSLTINPNTGLVEAFSLGGLFKSFIPMIAGGLLAATGVGAPLAALMVGGGSTILNKGDWKKGLMDGLGAFGGAGIGASLAGAGTAANAGLNLGKEGLQTIGKESLAKASEQGLGTALKGNLNLMGQGLKAAIPGTAGYVPGMAGQVAGSVGLKTAMAAGAPTLAAMSQPPTFKPGTQADPMYYSTSYNPGTYDPAKREFVGAGYGPGTWSKQYPGMPGSTTPTSESSATGKPNSLTAAGLKLNPNYGQPGEEQFIPAMAAGGVTPTGYGPSIDAYTGAEQMHDGGTAGYSDGGPLRFAAGGLSALPEYKAGGKLLNGPGDGMSDSIPAVIQGQKPQRAALADGEFVIPADVVSHLGNGSTKAGANQLYAMMDKVRQARTGTKKQGRQINPSRFVPA